MGVQISRESIKNYEEYFKNFQFESKFENLKNGKLETDKIHKFPVALKIENKFFDLIEKLKEFVGDFFQMNSQVAFFLNVVFKEDLLLIWLSFELLSGAEIIQDKFIYTPRSETYVYDFTTTTTVLTEVKSEFWSIFQFCFESDKKYNSLETIFTDLNFIKPDGILTKLGLENIIDGRSKQRNEEMLLKSQNNSNSKVPVIANQQKRKVLESNKGDVVEDLFQKKKKQIFGIFEFKSS